MLNTSSSSSSECQYPTCRRRVTNRTYCTNYHNKCEVLFSGVKKFEEEGDGGGSQLYQYLLDIVISGEENPLQPKKCLPEDLRFRHVDSRRSKTLTEFTIAFGNNYLEGLMVLLEAPVDDRHIGLKTKDMHARAEAFADLLGRTDKSTVRFMDGHGRFAILFFQKVLEKFGPNRLDSLHVQIVDNNAQVTAYHTSFYKGPTCALACKNITCLHQDVLFGLDSNTLLYLNFCGIGKSFPAVRDFMCNYSQPLLLSFSTMRGAGNKQYGPDAKEALTKSRTGMRLQTVVTGGRKDFRTYELVQQEEDFTAKKETAVVVGELKEEEELVLKREASAGVNAQDYKKKTVKELKKICKSCGLKGYSRLTKEALVQKLESYYVQDCNKEKTVKELKEMCKACGIKGYSRLTKEALVQKLAPRN